MFRRTVQLISGERVDALFCREHNSAMAEAMMFGHVIKRTPAGYIYVDDLPDAFDDDCGR